MLKNEANSFVDYNEIEKLTAELGFPVSVRTLRFYVDEGILPPPNRLGKKPVYDQDWILNVLLSLHIMKTRLNRQLKDIRSVLGNLTEDPKILADKLSVLYEDVVKSNEYVSVQRDWITTAFFAALIGQHTSPKQASEISLTDLAGIASEQDRWAERNGKTYWTEPNLNRVFQGLFGNSPKITIKRKSKEPIRVKAQMVGQLLPEHKQQTIGQKPLKAKRVQGEVEVVEEESSSNEPETVEISASGLTEEQRKQLAQHSASKIEVPENGISMLDARTLEEFFVKRVESAMTNRSGGGIYDCISKRALVINPRNCTPLHRDNTATIIQKMKSLQIYDRELLDLIPIERNFEYHIHKSGFFGRGELRVIVAALTVSPVEQFLEQRYGMGPLGPNDVERAIADLVLDPTKSYYVGLLSTTGWSPSAREYASSAKNLELHLVEKKPDGGWNVSCVQCVDDEPLMDSLFDPETFVEKVDRIKQFIKGQKSLTLRGGHIVIDNVIEDLGVTSTLVRAAMEQMVSEDAELEITKAAGLEILKRKRF